MKRIVRMLLHRSESRAASLQALVLCIGLVPLACKKDVGKEVAPPPQHAQALAIGLVTDVGGRGDQSFNDSALRGLETWAAGARFADGRYEALPSAAIATTIPPTLKEAVRTLGIRPVVVQSKSQEDYQPNLQLLVDQGAALVIGTGFLLENDVEAVARANPNAKFLLIDSPLLDAKGAPISLPNVRTVIFREEEGSFLVGALAGLVTKRDV